MHFIQNVILGVQWMVRMGSTTHRMRDVALGDSSRFVANNGVRFARRSKRVGYAKIAENSCASTAGGGAMIGTAGASSAQIASTLRCTGAIMQK